ncbi:MAG: hypothetical protein Q8L38_07765 [Pseudohongiella sp.]|nr:hypothetical protein [Pseudohongiella sp.]
MQELGLNDRGDTLSQWIAHYLAELFMAEKIAIGEAKVRLGEKITETVLLLWKNREHLPRYADPTERYSKAVEALRAIHLGMGARSKWDEFLPGKPMPAPLKFYEKSSRLGILGVLEMIPEASEDIPDWLAQLIISEEANFVAVLGDTYARLYAEHSATQLQSSPTQKKLREMRTKLLDELQELLDEMRKT